MDDSTHTHTIPDRLSVGLSEDWSVSSVISFTKPPIPRLLSEPRCFLDSYITCKKCINKNKNKTKFVGETPIPL